VNTHIKSLRNNDITGNKWAAENISLRLFSPNWFYVGLSKSVVFSIPFHLSRASLLHKHIEIIGWTFLSLQSCISLPSWSLFPVPRAFLCFDLRYRKSSFSSMSPTFFLSFTPTTHTTRTNSLYCLFFLVKILNRYRCRHILVVFPHELIVCCWLDFLLTYNSLGKTFKRKECVKRKLFSE
jgi:hypothetical protein